MLLFCSLGCSPQKPVANDPRVPPTPSESHGTASNLKTGESASSDVQPTSPTIVESTDAPTAGVTEAIAPQSEASVDNSAPNNGALPTDQEAVPNAESTANAPDTSPAEGTTEGDKSSQHSEAAPSDSTAVGGETDAGTAQTPRISSIVPPSRAYLPPNRNPVTPPLPPAKTERELAEERKSREAAKKRGEITFDDLVFDMEKDTEFKTEMLTDENWDLHEKTWKIRGFILPTTLFSQTGISEFVLVRDNQECCFGPGAALFDCVIVTMEPGKTISYTTRVVTVKGKLEIDTESFQYPDDEGHYAIYKMTAEEVK